MFVFDTNVLSAMMTPQPVPEVGAWVAVQDKDLFFTTSTSQAEISSGIAIKAAGRRRRDLQALATTVFAEDFEGRFDGSDRGTYRPASAPTPPLAIRPVPNDLHPHGACG
jgi:predicted nucleic acid-binding protein